MWLVGLLVGIGIGWEGDWKSERGFLFEFLAVKTVYDC